MDKGKPGRSLELLVADAVRSIGASKVVHDIEICGNQIDVYAEFPVPPALFHRVAVEVKDTKQTIGITAANKFIRIAEKLRTADWIDEGWIVSASGFSRQARNAITETCVSMFVPSDLNPKVLITLPTKPAMDDQTAVAVDVEHLPQCVARLLGRDEDLRFLDDAWDGDEIRIVVLVAPGGVGKSALVQSWLGTMRSRAYAGANGVYGWSFYSQGIGERGASAEVFINRALREWFRDSCVADSSLSSWDKGRQLACHLSRSRSLLVLDGLEPLQSRLEADRGRIRDPAIQALLRHLLKANTGMCVITTRERIPDLAGQAVSVVHRDLEQISTTTARALLQEWRVIGTDRQIETVAQEFNNHALTITLLGAYLSSVKGRQVSRASEVMSFPVAGGLDDAERRARKVITALAALFQNEPHRDVLRLLGLFDRPVSSADLDFLRVQNCVPDLTDRIHKLEPTRWNNVLTHLRAQHLLLPETRWNEGGIDAHPIVRAHFRWELQHLPGLWGRANSLLHEHYAAIPKAYQPDSLEELEYLYRAIDHACRAGRWREALDEILIKRLRRGDEHYTFFRGFLGQEITALSRFFSEPWTKLVARARLNSDEQGWLLNEAGSVLRVTGNLREAIRPILDSIRIFTRSKEFMRASRSAATLVNVYMLGGQLREAARWAARATTDADKSGSMREMIAKRSLYARVCYMLGRTQDTARLLEEAISLQGKAPKSDRLVTGQNEVLQCELLADRGDWAEAKRVIERAVRIVPERNRRSYGLVLSTYGCALFHLAQQRKAQYREAKRQLDTSVEMIRETGRQDELPRVLLVRAKCLILNSAFDLASEDLNEAYEVSDRLGFRLYLADACLGHARLYLALPRPDADRARYFLRKSRGLIRNCHYGQRNSEVAELKEKLQNSAHHYGPLCKPVPCRPPR